MVLSFPENEKDGGPLLNSLVVSRMGAAWRQNSRSSECKSQSKDHQRKPLSRLSLY